MWECQELNLELMCLVGRSQDHDAGPLWGQLHTIFPNPDLSDEEKRKRVQDNDHASKHLKDRLTIPEYCAYMTQRFVMNLDGFARAKTAPKTKSYALDADAVEDPNVVRFDPRQVLKEMPSKECRMNFLTPTRTASLA
jgi:hypothetical protein